MGDTGGRLRAWKCRSGKVKADTRTLTCSTVRGELISSPRRIMDLCVSTSESWKASKPRSSLATFSTKRNTHFFLLHGSTSLIGIFLQLGEKIPWISTKQVTKSQHKTHSPYLILLGIPKAAGSHMQCEAHTPIMDHSQILMSVSLPADSRKKKTLCKISTSKTLHEKIRFCKSTMLQSDHELPNLDFKKRGN